VAGLEEFDMERPLWVAVGLLGIKTRLMAWRAAEQRSELAQGEALWGH